MDVNSESIYGTRTWTTFGEGPLAEAANPMNAQGFNEGQKYSAKDVRYVQKAGVVYATIMDWPTAEEGAKGVTVPFTLQALSKGSTSACGKVTGVTLLGYGKVKFKQTATGLTVQLPTSAAAPSAVPVPVLRITSKCARKK